MDFGIEALGVQLPKYALDVAALAELHGVSPEKFSIGLGCRQMALCLEDETVVDLAVGAARRALRFWDGDSKSIGLLAVGTETSPDEARPLSAWVAEQLNLSGAIRSYEVKHACYGGALALRQAMEWHLSGAAQPGQVALVIAADVCLYPFLHPAEPTQGAGAVAFIVGTPKLCTLTRDSYCYSEPIFDFWRPTGQFYPTVQGRQSVDAYCRALYQCVSGFIKAYSLSDFLSLDRLCFHIPFPKMVLRALGFLSQKLGVNASQTQKLLEHVEQTSVWNRDIGNAYTASLWISFAYALGHLRAGQSVGMFSFGSGCGSEFMTGTVQHTGETPWMLDVEEDLKNREQISLKRYQDFRMKFPPCG